MLVNGSVSANKGLLRTGDPRMARRSAEPCDPISAGEGSGYEVAQPRHASRAHAQPGNPSHPHFPSRNRVIHLPPARAPASPFIFQTLEPPALPSIQPGRCTQYKCNRDKMGLHGLEDW